MSDSGRSKSRSPLRSRSNSPPESIQRYPSSHIKYDKPGECNLLHLRNIPKHWQFSDVKNVISKLNPEVAKSILFIRILKSDDNEPSGECLVLFGTYELCAWAWSELDGRLEYEGRSIDIMLDKETSFKKKLNKMSRKKLVSAHNNKPDKLQRPPKQPAQWKTSIKWNKSNNYVTYGLSTSYLNSLGIEPPLLSRIFVGNLDEEVDEAKLWEVFSLAGNIVVLTKSKIQTAKIEYDHPVEAVQAVAMFHDQPLFNKRLIVNIDKIPLRKRLLPAGLNSIGPGLGESGEALRGIRWSLELQELKQLLTQETDKKNEGANKSNPGTSGALNTNYSMTAQKNSVPNPFTQTNPFVSGTTNLSANNVMTSSTSLANPQASNNHQTLQSLNNIQALQSLLQQNQMGDLAAQLGALQQNILGQHVMGQNMMGQSVMGQNLTSQPVMGQNMAGQPVMGQNMTGQPGMGKNMIGQPVMGQNMMGQPVVGQNMMGQPGMGQNMIGQPVMGKNVMGQPVVEQNMMGQHVMGQTMVGVGQNNQSNHGILNQVDQTWSVNQAQSVHQTQSVNQTQSVKSGETSYNSIMSGSGFGVGINSDHEFNDGNGYITTDNYQVRENADRNLSTSSDMLVFTNLPPSVTLSALTSKLREVGELMFADMSGQGRALVRFKKMEDALRCMKIFDLSKVDGQMIDVRFF